MNFQNKYLPAVLLISLALVSPSRADVSFNFIYEDQSAFSAGALADIETAGNTVGSYFEENALINIKVDSDVTGGGTLAGGSSLYANASNSFNRGAVGFKIENELSNDLTGLGYEGTLSINLTSAINWGYGNVIGSDEFDFQATIMHELIHTVGFSSAIEEDGSAFQSTNGWNIFDYFVGDFDGAIIDLDSNNLNLDQGRWDAASVGGTGDGGLQWTGENAIAANGGQAVYLYSPTSWENGSSGSHLDDDFYTSDRFMLESSDGKGLSTRTLSAIEIGMLQDIGFNATGVPEPSSASILALSAIGLLLRRRRR